MVDAVMKVANLDVERASKSGTYSPSVEAVLMGRKAIWWKNHTTTETRLLSLILLGDHRLGRSLLSLLPRACKLNVFCSSEVTNLSCGTSCLNGARPEKSSGLNNVQYVSDESSTYEMNRNVPVVADGCNEECIGVCESIDGLERFDNNIGSGSVLCLSELDEHKNAALVIESIRRDEFGLDPRVIFSGFTFSS
ncbi:hypothetical protein CJ030_MR6G020546 [Morella rubra]|uniref:Uncharacterized protein n=1 Tax=Morella rubra TaxID=262757 RepID=A0A6A1VBM9_9ROSI|nr:hypothetical protein CJ030_MR6G020546 [Morella rubra]